MVILKVMECRRHQFEGQNDSAQNHALHKIYALINVKPAGGGEARGGNLTFFKKLIFCQIP